MVQSKEHIKSLGDETEIYELPDKEFKITIIRMLNE